MTRKIKLELRTDIPHKHKIWYHLFIDDKKYSVLDCGALMKTSPFPSGIFQGWEAMELIEDKLDIDNAVRANSYKELLEKILEKETKILKENRCVECSYTWFAKVEKPRQCPNCKRQIKY